MEQTITCPGCRYTFRIAKETFEKYREGISLKKHQMTDGEAVLLDCAGCGRTLKISITTWQVIADGPAEHVRGYEWIGGERPRLVGETESVADTEPSSPAASQGRSQAVIRLTEYGRIDHRRSAFSSGALFAAILLALLSVAMRWLEPQIFAALLSGEPPAPPAVIVRVAGSAETPVVVEPESTAPDSGTATEAAAKDEPRLLTPVKEPSFRISGKFEKMLKDHSKQMEDIEKKPESGQKGK